MGFRRQSRLRRSGNSRWVEHLIALTLAPGTLLNALAQRQSGSPLIQVPCLITLVSGHSCPGCGMTRALTLLWSGRLHDAIVQNPLSPSTFALLWMLFCLQVCRLVIFRREISAAAKIHREDPGAIGTGRPGGLWQSSVWPSRCNSLRE
ncbi:DUF2752 domain-containing protein [Acidicapsa acidisoli]|uniref:DUF2752 domain-containing protein n=1 Tax=Acidicapsa acidisoli TaxID=1615681 RepID=UPI0037BFA9C4